MIIKLLIAIAVILAILMSIFVILKVNSEENNDNTLSNVDKFVGKWKLINNEADDSEGEIPDTTEESDNFVDFETYEFLSNGTYYHVLDEDNTSGIWEINNSILVLTVDEPSGNLLDSYEFAFSDDFYRVTLVHVDTPEYFLELEKMITS